MQGFVQTLVITFHWSHCVVCSGAEERPGRAGPGRTRTGQEAAKLWDSDSPTSTSHPTTLIVLLVLNHLPEHLQLHLSGSTLTLTPPLTLTLPEHLQLHLREHLSSWFWFPLKHSASAGRPQLSHPAEAKSYPSVPCCFSL